MLRTALWLCVGVCVCCVAFCSLKCPDGSVCSDWATCCRTTHGYECCPYPKAVCCSDLTHCCPSEYSCDLTTQQCVKENQPWVNIPMVKKEEAKVLSIPDLPVTPFEELKSNNPPDQRAAVVHCDNLHACPDGTTCCRYARGGWFCCPYSPGRCCVDGLHCCPYGSDCDYTFTYCVREGLRYPFIPRPALTAVPASLVLSDDKSSVQQTPMTALTEAFSSSFQHGVIRCDNDFYCPDVSSCCKGPSGQWNCCPFPLGTCCADGQHCCQYGYKCDPSSSKCIK